MQRDHDALDLALARAAVELGLPVLAICRGHQVLNVALGGTLVQHIDNHRFVHHPPRLAPDCLGARAIGHDQQRLFDAFVAACGRRAERSSRAVVVG